MTETEGMRINLGLVLSIDIEEAAELKKYIASLTTARIIYQRKSIGRLKIVDEGAPVEGI